MDTLPVELRMLIFRISLSNARQAYISRSSTLVEIQLSKRVRDWFGTVHFDCDDRQVETAKKRLTVLTSMSSSFVQEKLYVPVECSVVLQHYTHERISECIRNGIMLRKEDDGTPWP